MNKILATTLALIMITAAGGPSYGATERICQTKDDVKDLASQLEPTAKVIREEDKLIVFSSPNKPTDLSVTFDDEGCAVEQFETIKINA